MNSKAIIAIAVVAVVAIAGVSAFVLLGDKKDTADYDGAAFNVISRVNSEGSGIFVSVVTADTSTDIPTRIDNGTPFWGANFSLSEANKAAWGGLVFADPGVSSIQHTQLASIASQVGLKIQQYTDGMSKSNDTLYYITNLSNYGAIMGQKALIDGGIIWEPQYQKVVQEASSEFIELALTNDLFDGHTCCIIAANHTWLGDNKDATEKFLAGYVEAVNFINNAKANQTSADYLWLVDFAVNNIPGLDEAEVRVALANITYLYADDDSGSLSDLKKDISSLSKNLKDLGVIKETAKFKSSDADKFADAFVDNTYIKDVLDNKAKTDGNASVKVAVIAGDIHQLAIHVAKEKGFFDKYNLTVDISTGSNGGDIATLLLSKDVNIGFLGAPPATSNTINGDHILV